MSTPEPVIEPLTWRVLQALQAQVQRVRISNGYYTDLGSDVRLSRASGPVNAARVHIVSPSDSLNDNEPGKGLRGARTVRGEMSVIVEYMVPGESTESYLNAHRGRADLIRVLRDDPALQPAGITQVRVTGRSILDPADGMPCVIAQITLTVSLVETTNPLSLPPA